MSKTCIMTVIANQDRKDRRSAQV